MVEPARDQDADDGDRDRYRHENPLGGGIVRAFLGGFYRGRGEGRLQPALERLEAFA